MKKNNTLQGKVALVTGGSRGIGRAIALALAEQGAHVAVSYVSSAQKAEELVQELQKLDVKAAAFKADQADTKQVEQLVKDVHKKFGQLDILVNNAGVAAYGQVGGEADLKALEHQQAVNVNGVITAIRTAAPLLPNGGRIVNIGSVLGARASFPGAADYSMTKFAVQGYTRGAARDLAPRGITVNAVQPGPIATDMNPENGPNAEFIRGAVPMGRFGKPEEIAAGVAFLASPAAAYITGTTLDIDGGYNA